METESGIMWSQAIEQLKPQEAGRGTEQNLP